VAVRTDHERSRTVVPWLQRTRREGGNEMNDTLILSSNAPRLVKHANMIVVTTPLDAINWLEDRRSISTVILAGAYARNDELASFLTEAYPTVHLEHEG